MKAAAATSLAMTLLVAPAMAPGLAGIAHAQTVYRCGADGRSFSQLPCEGGEALPPADNPSAARRAEAQNTAQREEALARRMTQDREAREKALQPAAAIGIESTLLRSGRERHKRRDAGRADRFSSPSSGQSKGKLGRREPQAPQ